ALLAWMWSFPGKKLLFMGGEFGQSAEWNHDKSLDWHLLEDPGHRGIQSMLAYANSIYRNERAFWEADIEPAGFQWLQADNAQAKKWDGQEHSAELVLPPLSVIWLAPEGELLQAVPPKAEEPKPEPVQAVPISAVPRAEARPDAAKPTPAKPIAAVPNPAPAK